MKEKGYSATHQSQPEELQTREQGQLVLVIEDDDGLRRLLAIALEYKGYVVVTTATVQDAESALQQWGDKGLKLVISDINLTRGSLDQEGYILYLRCAEKYPTLPYILLSADATNRHLPAIQAGKVHFLEKPFDIGALLRRVQGFLAPPPRDDPGHDDSHLGAHHATPLARA